MTYEDVKFDELKDVSVSQRSRSPGEIVYMVGKGDGSLLVYFITFDLKKGEITDINKTNLEKNKVQDYLTRDQISNAVGVIKKYDFYFFAIDSLQNVYINPFYANEPPYLLRLSASTEDSVIIRGYIYDLYRKKWYLNRTRRKG